MQSAKNIIVTGGSGFIGSHIVEKLCKNNHNVIVLDLWQSKEILELSKKSKKSKVQKSKYSRFRRNRKRIQKLRSSNSFSCNIGYL